jgi:flagellar basal body-associated protein FliL
MLEKNRMTSKIIFVALVVFFITTVCHAQGLFGGDFSTSSKTQIGNQKSQSNSSTTQGNTTNSTTTITTNNTSISSNTVTSDTNMTLSPKMTGHVLGPICRSRN